jgi:hypothetical protein
LYVDEYERDVDKYERRTFFNPKEGLKTLLFVPHWLAPHLKRGLATGCFRHHVFLVTHDAVNYSNGN